MQEIIDSLPVSGSAEYLVDTCFLFHVFEKGHVKKLEQLCTSHKVGMSSFNLQELLYNHHKFAGQLNHHLREFLKKRLISRIPVDAIPGDRESERRYVASFNGDMLKLVHDPSDAVLFVLAVRLHATILTRDKHHLFTSLAENYLAGYRLEILNEIPS